MTQQFGRGVLEQLLHTFRIVVAERQRQVLDRFGNARIDPRRTDEPVVDRKERMIAT